MSDIYAASSTNNTGAINNTGQSNQVEGNSQMGKDEFLKLLVTQLKYQDPLKPMDNKEFISQTAQFTSLEQMKNMNSNLSESLEMQKLSQVSGLVNKEVKVLKSSGETESDETQYVTGVIEKVKMTDDGPKLLINEEEYDLGSVTEVLG
jgi:flagellar basal-body rod modification protein FlgD